MTIFEDGELRNLIFRYYLQSSDAINTLEYEQRRKYELENKRNELVIKIKSENPVMSNDDAMNQAPGYMVKENIEYIDLNSRIPLSVSKLKEFKHTAVDIINRLKNIKQG